MSVAEHILNEIIKQGMVNVSYPDPDETHVFVWNANTLDQLNATVREHIQACDHGSEKRTNCGTYEWCSQCGSVREMLNGIPFSTWKQPDLV